MRVAGGARRVERIEADLALPLDVTDEESAAAFVGRAAAELGIVDILYNNAASRSVAIRSGSRPSKTRRRCCTRTSTGCCA